MIATKGLLRWGSFGLVICGLWFALLQPLGAEVTALSARLDELVKGSGFKSSKVNDTAYVIDFAGKQLAKIKVVVTVATKGDDGIVVIYANPADKAQLGNSANMMSALLKANNEFDFVKVGVDNDGDAVVRGDIPSSSDIAYFKRIVEQVAAATDELYGKIKPMLR
jgi:hypothetical protein